MRRGIGDVAKERHLLPFPCVVVYIIDRLIADRIGIEEILALVFDIDPLVLARQRIRIVKASRARDRPEEAIEAALPGPAVLGPVVVPGDMPLAAHIGSVARPLEHLGNRRGIGCQVAAIAIDPIVVHHVPDISLVRMQPGQQRRPGRATARRIVKLCKTQTAFRQAIQIRRLDLAAVAAQVGKAHIVVENQQDIRSIHRMLKPRVSESLF